MGPFPSESVAFSDIPASPSFPESHPLTVKVFQKMEAVPRRDWEAVYPRVLEGYDFFKSLDESHLEQFSFYYLVVYRGAEPVGATTAFIMDYSIGTTMRGFLKGVLAAAEKALPAVFRLRTVMCGQPIAQARLGFVGDGREVLEAVRQCLEDIAERERAVVVVFKEFDDTYALIFDRLKENGYYRTESLPNTVKALTFKNFDDYLMSLSYATRYDLKRKFKKIDGKADIRMEVVSNLGEALDEAYGLYRQMLDRHEVSFEIMSKEFFAAISRNMPGETKFFLWRLDGKLVAFAFCLVSGDYFLDYYLGLDYAYAYDYHLYFVRFRDMMKWCFEHGMKTYEMGCTNYDPKKRLDFTFVSLYLYVKFRSRWINRFSKYICEAVNPRRFDPDLKVMDRKKTNTARLTRGVFLLILASEGMDTIAQVLMKKGLPFLRSFEPSVIAAAASKAASSIFLQSGVLLYASNFFIWILILARLDVSTAVPLTSVNYAVLPLLALILLHEKISLLRWAGIGLVAFGLWFISRTGGEGKAIKP